MSKGKRLVCLLSTVVILASVSFGATQNRIVNGISGAPVAMRGQVHRLAQAQFDLGHADPAMQLGTMMLMTVPTPAQKKALDQLLADQQNPKSRNYHKWLTPEQFADRFGLSQNDIQLLVTWLKSQGFTQVHPARGRLWVSFTGTAAQVESAFGTEIHRYNVNGELHYANATSPKLPASLSAAVSGVQGFNDFRPRPRANKRALPKWVSSTLGDFIAPGDIATIYDINALYSAGIDGTGQKLAVMGQTDIYLADLQKFRTGFGLSSISCTTNSSGVITACNDPHFKYVLDPNSTDPGLSKNGDIGEADLDIEWSGAVARGAQIIYVNSSDTFTSFGYAIDQNLAPVISLSYGFCEFDDNILPQHEAQFQQANSQGITFVNSSGDSGAAECDFSQTVTSTNLATQGIAVSYPASSPSVTGVGGTGVTLAAWNSSTYWGNSNGTNGGTALSYVPEQVWNDDLEIFQFCQANPTNLFCTQGGSTAQPGWVNITSEAAAQTDIGISSSGGGASNCSVQNSTFTSCVSGFPKPSWQTVTISGQSTRLSPDISFFASPNFPGYVFCTPLSELSNTTSTTSSCATSITDAVDTHLSIIGGTSASAPVFAGIITLLNQYLIGANSSGLGNVNPMLYQLALSSSSSFHQVTSGDNFVSCVAGTPTAQPSALRCPSSGVLGFSGSTTDATTGYNLVTGLGSMDVNNFFTAWAASRTATTTALAVSNSSPFQGESITLTATLTPSTATGTVTFKNGASSIGTATLSSGVATLAISTLPLGTNSITASYMGNATLNTSTSTASSVTISTAFTMTPTAASFQVAQGSNVDATVDVALTTGFSGTITFSCAQPGSLITCTPPPSANASGNVSFHIVTTPPTAKLQRPLDRSTKIFYAAFLPGMLGIFFVGSRKRSLRGMRLLGLLMILGMSTLWMASCGGSGSGGTTSNPGTPKGTYTINATGTSGSATATTSFQLIVQ